MSASAKAEQIRLRDFTTPHMRAFHITWFSFFLCFFAWFGIAPLMPHVRAELGLTKDQIGNTIIASVAITILARLLVGWLCDRYGPRLTYTGLLIVASLPVMSIGLARSYESFLLFRLAIGVIGASFVITQYHTSLMFAPNCVGTANATTAGWGNLGGGVTQMVMPLIFAALMALGAGTFWSWRLCMIAAGLACLLMAVAYFRLTQDTPAGNFSDLRKAGRMPQRASSGNTFTEAARDTRVWALFVIYAACFGIELTINNIAALYFMDYFEMTALTAGITAGLFGLMNLFARTLGGLFGDRFGVRSGLKGRVYWLFGVLLAEGLCLMLFSQMSVVPLAIGTMVLFSLFVQMSEGATFSVVPFINRRALGSVAGIVAAGGNVGAVLSGFLFKGSIPWPHALLIMGAAVTTASFLALLVRFTPENEEEARRESELRLREAGLSLVEA